MQTMSERKELRSAVEKWKTPRAPHSGPVANNPAISKVPDLASEIAPQTNERSTFTTFYRQPDAETFDGPACWLVAIAVIAGLIAFTATKL